MADELKDLDPKRYTPETVQAALVKINRILALKEMQAKALHELAQALVAKVQSPIRWRRVDGLRYCARCGRVLGLEGGEYVLKFDTKFWHVGNCT